MSNPLFQGRWPLLIERTGIGQSSAVPPSASLCCDRTIYIHSAVWLSQKIVRDRLICAKRSFTVDMIVHLSSSPCGRRLLLDRLLLRYQGCEAATDLEFQRRGTQTWCLSFFFLATAYLPQPFAIPPTTAPVDASITRPQQYGARSDFRCRSPPSIPRPEESTRSARLQSARPGCARTNQSDGRAKRLQPYGRQQVRPRSAELNLLWSIPQDYVDAC